MELELDDTIATLADGAASSARGDEELEQADPLLVPLLLAWRVPTEDRH